MDGLARINTPVFDKTGTLTLGELKVTDILGHGDFTEQELLMLATCAEEHYTHPVTSAMVQAAKIRNLTLSPTS